jgi:hypothetical protein
MRFTLICEMPLSAAKSRAAVHAADCLIKLLAIGAILGPFS